MTIAPALEFPFEWDQLLISTCHSKTTVIRDQRNIYSMGHLFISPNFLLGELTGSLSLCKHETEVGSAVHTVH